MLPTTGGIIDNDLADQCQRSGWRRSQSQNRDRPAAALAGHEDKGPADSQRRQSAGQPAVEHGPRAVGHAVLVGVHQPEEFSV